MISRIVKRSYSYQHKSTSEYLIITFAWSRGMTGMIPRMQPQGSIGTDFTCPARMGMI